MKRPPGAIPPLTKEGLRTLIGKRFPVRRPGNKAKVRWRHFSRLDFHTETDAVFMTVETSRRISLGQCRFDPEDELVASVRRLRFLAKLNGSIR